MSTVTISKKGWIVIPAPYRKKYKLSPGDQVQVLDDGEGLTIIPPVEDAIDEARGLLKGDSSLVSALLSERRQEREK